MLPSSCVDSVARYLNGDQYGSDYDVIVDYALAFAKTVKISGDGKDVWIFDIDETLLTNIGYYKNHSYGYVLLAIRFRSGSVLIASFDLAYR